MSRACSKFCRSKASLLVPCAFGVRRGERHANTEEGSDEEMNRNEFTSRARPEEEKEL